MSFILLLLSCFAMRSLSFLVLGVRKGTDSISYLQRAEEFSRGILPEMSGTTHQPLFSLLLAPAYLLHFNVEVYFVCFSLSVSLISLFLVKQLRVFESKTKNFASLIVFILIPSTNFWSVYILSDSTFVFALLLYLLSTATFLKTPSFLNLILWIASSLIMLGVRLHALPLLGATSIYFILKHLLVNLTIIRRFFLSITLSFFLLLFGIFIFFQQPWLTNKLLTNASFNQSLWFSTQRVTNIDEMLNTHSKEHEINRLSKLSPSQISPVSIKAREGIEFIKQNPFTYLIMAAERFIVFWFPWIFAKKWSQLHIMLDALVSLFLFSGLLFSWPKAIKENDFNTLKLFCILSLCLQVSFSVADTDSRYRFPVEILSFSLALDGWQMIWKKIKSSVYLQKNVIHV